MLDARLSGQREYVAGPGPLGRYSIADMSLVGWVNVCLFSGIDLAGGRRFPNVKAWYDRLLARPAVRRGLIVPGGLPGKISNGEVEKALRGQGGEEARKRAEGRWRFVEEAKEKYGYKYASP